MTSKLYDRKCYGYVHNKEGKLTIKEETKAAQQIFEWYLSDKSILEILKEPVSHEIKSLTGKDFVGIRRNTSGEKQIDKFRHKGYTFARKYRKTEGENIHDK